MTNFVASSSWASRVALAAFEEGALSSDRLRGGRRVRGRRLSAERSKAARRIDAYALLYFVDSYDGRGGRKKLRRRCVS